MCLEGTCNGLLQEIEKWANNIRLDNVYLLLGTSGTGKSTIVRTIAEKFRKEGRLASYQLFQNLKDNSKDIEIGINIDLAKTCRFPQDFYARSYALRLGNGSISSFGKLIPKPLPAGSKEETYLIVLDCSDNYQPLGFEANVFRAFVKELHCLPENLRFLITVNYSGEIPTSLEKSLKKGTKIFRLDPNSEMRKKDVSFFIETRLREIDPTLCEGAEGLSLAAGGLFLWASRAIEIIEKHKGYQMSKLKELVKTKSILLNNLYNPIYTSFYFRPRESKHEYFELLSLIVLSREGLNYEELEKILGLESQTAENTLIRSDICIDYKPKEEPIYIDHSFRHLLILNIEMKSKKYFIATRCLGVMNNNLSECIPYPLSPSGTNNKSPTAPGQIPRFVTYCCRYWAHHLKEVEDISISGDLVSELDTFLNENLFRWLVCLDSTESLDAGVIKAVKDASERIKVSTD